MGWDGFYESDAIMDYGREKVINSRCLLEMENDYWIERQRNKIVVSFVIPYIPSILPTCYANQYVQNAGNADIADEPF